MRRCALRLKGLAAACVCCCVAHAAMAADPLVPGFSPFSPMRQWWRAPQGQAAQPDAVVRPSVLSHPLAVLRYQGYLERAATSGRRRQRIALITAGEQLFTVRVGQRVGLEGARVRAITDASLDLVVRMGAGSGAQAFPQLRLAHPGPLTRDHTHGRKP